MSEPDSQRRRIKELEVMVADVVTETPDTTTLVLFTGYDRLDYLAGHFLTIDLTFSSPWIGVGPGSVFEDRTSRYKAFRRSLSLSLLPSVSARFSRPPFFIM